MADDPLPEDVDAFVQEHIHSVEQLEVLLLLRRASNETWNAELVARELRIDASSAALRLEDLLARKLVAKGDFLGRYQYGPADPRLDRVIEKLARTYAERRVSVITRIFTKPDPAHSFAEAFRIKERK